MCVWLGDFFFRCLRFLLVLCYEPDGEKMTEINTTRYLINHLIHRLYEQHWTKSQSVTCFRFYFCVWGQDHVCTSVFVHEIWLIWLYSNILQNRRDMQPWDSLRHLSVETEARYEAPTMDTFSDWINACN